MRERSPTRLAQLGILAAIYVAAGKLGLSMAILHPNASPVWPPTGIAIASLLLLGRSSWPAITLGALVVNLTTTGHVFSSVGIAIGNTLEAVTAVALVERFASGRRVFDRAPDFLAYTVLAGFVATLVSATIGVTVLCVAREQVWTAYGSTWWTWWLGDAGGALIVAPPLVLWGAQARFGWSRWRALEGLGLLLSVVAAGELVFLGHLAPTLSAHPLTFVCVPPLLWAALRFGPRETATAGTILAAMATWATLTGTGPYSSFGPNAALLVLQGFMVITMVTAMTLAAVVRERAQATELLHENARELARSNADLEQFAYSASHDLKEPLRNLLLNVQLVERDHGGELATEAQGYLRVASHSARRMLALIHDLLAYARVGTVGERIASVDAQEVVRGVLDDVRLAIDESQAVVTVGPLPLVAADPHQLGEVFQNLIGNAIKFRCDESPRVEIGAERSGVDWRFFVRDNGIGIDPTQHERVFEIFQRLHGRERYPGSGIGLATCKRILQRHGGRIWVESQPACGSSFFFTLPCAGEPAIGAPSG